MNSEYTLVANGNFGRSEFITYDNRKDLKEEIMRIMRREDRCSVILGPVRPVKFRVVCAGYYDPVEVFLEDEPGYMEK